MKISSLMKDYLGEKLLREQASCTSLLPESFLHSDLPLEPARSEWQIASEPERLHRMYTFDNLEQRSLFVEELLHTEEQHGHHAKITVSGKDVLVEVWTHNINSVTELDQEYASACDMIYNDISLIRFTHEY